MPLKPLFPKRSQRHTLAVLALITSSSLAGAQTVLPGQAVLERCWLEQMRLAPADTTMATLRAACASLEVAATALRDEATAPVFSPPPPAALAQAAALVVDTGNSNNTDNKSGASHRLLGEWAAYDNPYTLTLNRPTYFLFGHQFTRPNTAPFTAAFGDGAPQFEDKEAKFQISLKAPLALGLLGAPVDVMAGYTHRSFWQIFNKQVSAPFRESNHEPEIWARWRTELPLLGGQFRVFSLGLNHQSNGQSGPLSRSWNRVFVETLYEYRPLALNVRAWQRLKETERRDDNPDIVDYMGNLELTAIYGSGKHEFSAMLRRNFATRRGAVQADWSFPLYKNLRGYVQWFDGYGESLIDYNHKTRSLGFGVQLGGWLL